MQDNPHAAVGRPARPGAPESNTAALLFQAYLRLADVLNSATREYEPRARPAHATVFIHMELDGIRLTRLAAISGVERRLARLLGRQTLADLHAALGRIITGY